MSDLTPSRRDADSSRLLAVASVVLIGLAASLAYESRHHASMPGNATLLFPGFTADAVPSPGSGLVITSLRTGSEAQRDGIAVGDEVLAIDNHPVTSLDDVEQIIGGSQHDQLALRLLHNNRRRELTLHTSGMKLHEP